MRNKRLFGLIGAGMLIVTIGISGCARTPQKSRPLVFQTDFGLKDGAVSAMKGVAFTQFRCTILPTKYPLTVSGMRRIGSFRR